MADAHFQPQPNLEPQLTTPSMGSTTPSSKRRKIIGQCPTCHQSFGSRHELHAHMSNPQTHAPASDSDAISFGEMSSDYDSLDEDSHPRKPSNTQHDDEPSVGTDSFEFSHSGAPSMDQDGFEFIDTDPAFFPSAAHFNAEQGSVHTMPDADEQPSAEATSFAQSSQSVPRKPQQHKAKGALGVLYCGTCDKYFGNEKVFKRHFMFGVKHGEEPRDMRDLYYRVWGQTWADEAIDMERKGRVAEVDAMEL